MPTLYELRRQVAESLPEHWNVISSAHSNPTFRFEVTASKWNGQTHVETVHHHSTASLISDVSLTIAWGLSDSDDQRSFDWAKWPDPSVFTMAADIFWNGALVDRLAGLVVDGGRAYLPFPKLDTSVDSELVDFFFGEEVAIWRLINDLTGGHDFDRYISNTGLDVR